jgi:indolepyruvate ferredoxin oxidoreductase
MGDSISANMMLLGVAWQKGWVPITLPSLMQAIELNGVQIAQSKQAFEWGRRAAVDPARVAVEAGSSLPLSPAGSSPVGEHLVTWHPRQTQSLEELIAHRTALLIDYGGASKGKVLASRYQSLLTKATATQGASDKLLRAIATQYFRLLAVKDEWEVARLYAAPEFAAQLKETFTGDFKIHFHLGAWPFAKTDPVTGNPIKAELGTWVLPVFKVMAKMRGLRGSMIDPFKRSEERVLADELVVQYEADLELVLGKLNTRNLDAAVKLANLPEKIRGYGHVRRAAAKGLASDRTQLISLLV